MLGKKTLIAFLFSTLAAGCVKNGSDDSVRDNDGWIVEENTLHEIPAPPEWPEADTAVFAAPQKSAAFDLVFGDSVGAGLKRASHAAGDTQKGRTTQQILDAVLSFPRDSLQGKNILLTLGAGNGLETFDLCAKDLLAAIKNAQPTKVVIMGISDQRTDIDAGTVNAKIEDLARQFGFIYGGAITNAGGDKIHPPTPGDYTALHQQALNALRGISSAPQQTPTSKAPASFAPPAKPKHI